MRIAIVSDIHDHVDNLARVLPHLADCGALLCLGDLCSPFVVPLLAEGFPGPIHLVFGNNDGDLHRITRQAAAFPQVSLHGEFAVLELAGRRLALTHFPAVARALDPGAFDLIAYGHDHAFALPPPPEGTGALRVNPGTLMGYRPLERRATAVSWIVYHPGPHSANGWRLQGDEAVPHAGDA